MGVLRIVGFALVVVLVIAGLDYYQQDKKRADTLSASGYIDTIKERFALFNEELDAEQIERDRKQRWRAGSEPYAPKSGEDWVRRAIVDRDYTRDAREGVLQNGISEAARPLAKQVAVQKVQQLAEKLDRTSWVYENGTHTIWLQVSLKEDARSNTLTGNIVRSVDTLGQSGADYAPFAIVGGVAYFQFKQNKYSVITVNDRSFWSMVTAGITDLDAPVEFDIYKGTLGLGQEVRMQLYSNAPPHEVRKFLAKLDYDGMNALLRKPVPGVSNDRTTNPETEDELAIEMAGLRGEFMKLRAELARLRLDNINGLSLVANTLAAQYGLSGDTFDLTANKIKSADDLIQVGYRTGLTSLLDGEVQKADAEGGNMFGRLFASFKGGDNPQEASSKGGGFLDGLKSMFQNSETAQAPEVRVNKGGAGLVSKCATKDAFKTCTLTDG
ncbi:MULTISPECIES: hypothetical protein [unclassified Ruegeria]|uniref:hypothetical protein n=1 Tax=unclassified Ruegeria TaxID=2625375 RepID=UPI001489BEA0|nr:MULTISPECIES: hypothetical protein [unclassified Ruegeria]